MTTAIGGARGVEEVVVPGVPLDPIVWGLALDAEGKPRPVLEPAAVVGAPLPRQVAGDRS